MGASARFLPFLSMQDTIEAVSSGEVDCSIVPIENSIEGSVSATVDILTHEIDNLQIVREVRIPVRHQLLARPGVTLEQITKVVSHPHANAQCRIWLRQNLPGREIEAANSTANAVERVAKSDQPWAAIGNQLAGETYGCVVLAPDIEDHKDNETRFVFLARQRERQDWFEPYKTSVVCEIVQGPARRPAPHPAGVRLPAHQPHQDRIPAVQAASGRLPLPRRYGGQGGRRPGGRRPPLPALQTAPPDGPGQLSCG